MKKLTIYSKFCIPCVYGTEYLNRVRAWGEGNGYGISIKRTAYNPIWQAEAKKYRPEYEAFVVLSDKMGSYDFKTFLDDVMPSQKAKTKPVKNTKRKAKDDVQGLPKTTKRIRVDDLSSPACKVEVEIEGKE